MNEQTCCDACRKIIEGALTTVELHGALHTRGLTVGDNGCHSAIYECHVCHTKFEFRETKPSSQEVMWKVIE